MHMVDELAEASSLERRSADGPEALSRRAMLLSATVAAGAVAGTSAAHSEPPTAAAFGAPLAELHFPAGVLTSEQKAAMIKGVTDVLLNAIKLPPEHANRLWVQIFETAEAGWGIGGNVFVPRGKAAR